MQSLIIIIPHFNKGGGFNRQYLYMQGIYFYKKKQSPRIPDNKLLDIG